MFRGAASPTGLLTPIAFCLYIAIRLKTIRKDNKTVQTQNFPKLLLNILSSPMQILYLGVCIPDATVEFAADCILDPILEVTLDEVLDCDAASKLST